jgi:hypothetical protein
MHDLIKMMKEINIMAYDIIDYFDKTTFDK